METARRSAGMIKFFVLSMFVLRFSFEFMCEDRADCSEPVPDLLPPAKISHF
jgi:hypothetical protein